MTDEHNTEITERIDSATVPTPQDEGMEPGNASSAGESAAESSGTNRNSETYAVATGEDEQRRAAFTARQLFSQAQEQFAAGEFIAANRLLKQIPEDAQTPDVRRLLQLVTERIREIAELRSEIQTALNERKHASLPDKLQRLIELQPGDNWANTIRHRLDEDEYGQIGEVQPIAVSVKEVFTKPRPREVQNRPKKPESRPARPPLPSKPELLPQTMAVEIVEDDADVDQIWEFGERLVKSSPPPPPLRQSTTRPDPSKPRPTRPVRPPAESDDIDDDFVGWLEPDRSSTGLWIAIAVSGIVILLALIATIVVLVLEKGG